MENLTELRSKLEAWLQTKMPEAKEITILNMQHPGMGVSSETHLFDMQWDEPGEAKSMAVVLRCAPRSRGVFPEYDLGLQFRIMKVLKENTDVPVAEMLWLEEDLSVIGVPFFLMRRLTGDVPQDYPSYHGSGTYFEATPEIRKKMWWGCLEAMIKLHKADWRSLGLDSIGAPGPGMDPVNRQLAYWERYFNHWIKESPQESHPTIEATLVWLKENQYEPERVTLCWGDAKMGNVLYGRPDRDVLALMDWELAFIGDPEADLATLYISDKRASRGFGLPPLEGTPTVEEIVRRYEELAGWKVKHLFYNEVLAAFWRGLAQIGVIKSLRSKGVPIEDEMILNNFQTQHLSRLLGLPSPGPDPYMEEKGDISQLTVSIQFHFTGLNGYDWYLVSDKGNASRYAGCVENPDLTIEASKGDWIAIQTGELNRFEAMTTGRLVTRGNAGLLTLLEDVIAKYS